MTILKLFVKGIILLLASLCLFTGMMRFTDTLILDVMPDAIFDSWSVSWGLRLFDSILMTALGLGLVVLYQRITGKWNPEVL